MIPTFRIFVLPSFYTFTTKYFVSKALLLFFRKSFYSKLIKLSTSNKLILTSGVLKLYFMRPGPNELYFNCNRKPRPLVTRDRVWECAPNFVFGIKYIPIHNLLYRVSNYLVSGISFCCSRPNFVYD